jgi:serpin B
MKKSQTLIILFLLFIILSCATTGKSGKQKTNKMDNANQPVLNETEETARHNNEFAFETLAGLEREDENLFFSPYSISSALAMTYAGATGKTATEMADVMNYYVNKENNNSGFHQLNNTLQQAKGENTELNIANALWVQQDFSILPEYLNNITQYYDAPVKKLSFKNDIEIEKSRKEINNWVADETRDKIQDLIQPGILSQLTRMVLTNAIYFKAGWQHPFDASKTEKAPFYSDNGKEISSDFMHQTGSFRYFENEKYQAVELPYDNGNYAMLIILPVKNNKKELFSKNISNQDIEDMLNKSGSARINLYIPKFKLTSTLQLGNTLSDMGMKDAFSKNADFSGINGKKNLYIDAVIHKAFVGVEEKGTEAAASTAVVMSLKSAMPVEEKPVLFRADHPFLFLIRERSSGCILFMGKLSDPS